MLSSRFLTLTTFSCLLSMRLPYTSVIYYLVPVHFALSRSNTPKETNDIGYLLLLALKLDSPSSRQ
jgi:hypothetical protein